MLQRSVWLTILSVAVGLCVTSCRDSDANEDSDARDRGLPGSDGGTTGADDHTIQQVQDSAMPVGTPVELKGVVVVAIDTFGNRTGSVYVMEPGGGPFSGVQLFLSGTQAAGLNPGDLVDIAGVVKDEFALQSDTSGRTLTELKAGEGTTVSLTKVGTVAIPQAEIVDPRQLAASDDEAEKWEGVLIKFENVAVTSAPRGVSSSDDTLKEMDVTGPFGVGSSLTGLADTIAREDCYAEIVGIGDYFFNYKILPRSGTDLVIGGTGCPMAETASVVDDPACSDNVDNDFNGFKDCEDRGCQDATLVPACFTDATIVQVQDGTLEARALVTLSDVVVTAIDSDRRHLWVQDSTSAAAHNGVYVFRGGAQPLADANIVVGAVVNVVGTIDEFTRETGDDVETLTEIVRPVVTFSAAASGSLAPLTGVPVATLRSPTEGRPYEGVLVRIDNVKVVEGNNTFGEFTVGVAGQTLVIDGDIYEHSATPGDCLTITGVMHYNGFQFYRTLLPRSADDIEDAAGC